MNKKLFNVIRFVAAFTLLFVATTHAQQVGVTDKMPEYMLADNANPAVLITFRSMLPQSGGFQTESVYSYKRNGALDLYNLSIKLYDQFVTFLQEDLSELNIHNPVFINMGAEKANANSDVQADNNIRKILYDNHSQAMINIVISIWPSERRLSKGKATREDYAFVMYSILPYDGGSALTPEYPAGLYFTGILKNEEQFINTMQTGIAKTGARKFLKTITPPFYPETFNEIKEFNSAPADLSKYELLVTKYVGMMEGFTNNKIEKAMDKHYPYKYKLVDRAEMMALKKAGKHKYLVEPRYASHEKTSSGLSRKVGGMMQQKVTTSEVAETYYVIRDLQTNDIYYCGTQDDAIQSDNQMPSSALKDMLERISHQ